MGGSRERAQVKAAARWLFVFGPDHETFSTLCTDPHNSYIEYILSQQISVYLAVVAARNSKSMLEVMQLAAKPEQMPPKAYKPRTNMLSRAFFAKSPNSDSEDDEDDSGSSSFSDDRDEQSDADDEDGDLHTNKREEQNSNEESESTQARPSARGNRSGAPADNTQVEADARLARDLGVRRSTRNQGHRLGRLHYLGLDSQPRPEKTKKVGLFDCDPLVLHLLTFMETLIKEVHSKTIPTAPNIYLQDLWIDRKAEEDRAHSFSNPFLPTIDGDVNRWIAQGAPPHLTNPYTKTQELKVDPVQQKAAMRTQSHATPINGQSNGIVQEWLSPNDAFQEDFSVFKTLSDDEQQAVIRREAEQYGLEKPQGYNVSFHYNPHVEYHHFGSSHPMKPWRLTLTKQLVLAYGLEYTMDCYEPRPARFDELAVFHDREYLSFLSEYVETSFPQ